MLRRIACGTRTTFRLNHVDRLCGIYRLDFTSRSITTEGVDSATKAEYFHLCVDEADTETEFERLETAYVVPRQRVYIRTRKGPGGTKELFVRTQPQDLPELQKTFETMASYFAAGTRPDPKKRRTGPR